MNKWKLKARCALAIFRGQGVMYGIHFIGEIQTSRFPRHALVANCLFTEPVSQSLFNTEEILADVDEWLRGTK